MTARFILDLDADTWSVIYSGLVAQAYLNEEEQPNIKQAVASLEIQALNADLMTKEDLLKWRQEIIDNLPKL